MMKMKGMMRLKKSQVSIILMYDVSGRVLFTLVMEAYSGTLYPRAESALSPRAESALYPRAESPLHPRAESPLYPRVERGGLAWVAPKPDLK